VPAASSEEEEKAAPAAAGRIAGRPWSAITCGGCAKEREGSCFQEQPTSGRAMSQSTANLSSRGNIVLFAGCPRRR
jgi:hypothetical protein